MNMSKAIRCYRAALRVRDLTGENAFKLFLEVIYNWFRYGASDEDFIRFGFYRFNAREKKRWLTSRRNNHYLVSTLLDSRVISTFDNKELFDKTFSSYMKHEVLFCSESSPDGIEYFIKKHKTVIVKPQNGALGRGVYRLSHDDHEGVSHFKLRVEKGEKLIVEEVIKQHPCVASLNPASVNTIRVITMIDLNGKVHILNTVAMIGSGEGCVSNTHSGGLLCHIDTDSGIIDYRGIDLNGNSFLKHPFTGIVLPGYQFPNWKGLLEYAKTLAQVIPTARYIGWDIVILENGYDVIEGNIHPGQGFQATDGVGRWKMIKKMM